MSTPNIFDHLEARLARYPRLIGFALDLWASFLGGLLAALAATAIVGR
jgi:hypothetical protein